MLMALCSQGEKYIAFMPRRMTSDSELQLEAEGLTGRESTSDAQPDAQLDVTSWIAARRAGELRLVSLSIDEDGPVVEEWLTTEGLTGVFLHGARVQAVLDRMSQANVLMVSVAAGNTAIESTFDLGGSEAALAALHAACTGAPPAVSQTD